ncbi:MAG: hypothetical protein ACRDSJ_16095 [Rubrobacteraceae bacterium]
MDLIQPSTFVEVGMQERRDLQVLLRDNPSVIGSDLFVFAEEFSNWQESSRRIDLLAMDRDANLIVIELKQVEEGGHMELQAIRYAAMVSAMDFEAVVKAYEKLLADPKVSEKRGNTPAVARQALLNFLDAASAEEVAVSSAPRVILMSPSFSKEITTTVLWLNDQGLDIRCLEVKPYKLDEKLYLDVEQVIPLPSAEAYIIQQREKVSKAEGQAKAKRRERSLSILVNQDILEPDTRLYLIKPPRPDLEVHEEAKHATFVGEGKARWDHDGETYPLSALCKKMCEEFGGEVGSGAFPGPDFWAIGGEKIPLSERARNLGSTEDNKSHE